MYVFDAVGGWIECCACPFDRQTFSAFRATTADEMRAHLAEHVAAGHMVPVHVAGALVDPEPVEAAGPGWVERNERRRGV